MVLLQVPEAEVTVLLTAQQMPAAGALQCQSPSAATPSLVCISAGDCQIRNVLIQT